MQNLDHSFWQNRYLNDEIGWDLGIISPPLKKYFDQLVVQKNKKILIPGAGNAYEAEYLLQLGFEQTYILDWAKSPLEKFKIKNPHINEKQLLNTDYLSHKSKYNLIVEQTFFCTFLPKNRALYAKKTHELLTPGGKLVGLLFNREFENDHPPFGGNEAEYRKLFSPYFEIEVMEMAYNSVKPRSNSELFIHLRAK